MSHALKIYRWYYHAHVRHWKHNGTPLRWDRQLVESGFVQFHCNRAQRNKDYDSIDEDQLVGKMVDHILQLNDRLGRLPTQRWSMVRMGNRSDPKKHYEKAKKHNFFLGLDANFEWLRDYTEKLTKTQRKEAEESKHEDSSDDDDDDDAPELVAYKFAFDDRVLFEEPEQRSFPVSSCSVVAATVLRCHDRFHKGVPMYVVVGGRYFSPGRMFLRICR